MTRLCIKNLGKNTSEKQIKDLFSKKGEVTDVRIVKTKAGKSRRFAFVGFRTDLQAKEAQDYFHNTYLDTSRIQIESALKVNDSSLEEIKLRNSKKKLDVLETKNLEKSERKEKLNNTDNKDEPKELSKNDKKKSKEVKEFLEAMKPRRSAQVWANDETVIDNYLPEDNNNINNDDKTNNTHDNENNSDNDSDEDDINDFTNIKLKTVNKKDKKDKNNDGKDVRPEGMTDMEYLRSKISSNFSDSDDDKEIKSNNMYGDEDKDDDDDNDDDEDDDDVNDNNNEKDDDEKKDEDTEDANDSGRLFIRNLPFSCSEDELKELFTPFGPVTEIHIPLDAERKGKGYSFIQYMIPEHAMIAKDSLDGSAFQGRLLHIISAKKPRESDPDELKNKSNGRMSSYQQKKEEERRNMAGRKEGWNASFVRSDAVVDTLAEKYGVKRSDILDTKEGGGEMAVRLAIGEAMVIQENHAYFTSHGVDIAAIESISSASKASARSTTTLLIKNLPHDLVEDELESMFSRFGSISSFLVPKSKSVALIDFVEPSEARQAFKGLAYRKYKHFPLYLEWAPLGIIDKSKAVVVKKDIKDKTSTNITDKSNNEEKNNVKNAKKIEDDDGQEFASIFIKNLNFITTEAVLEQHLIRVLGRSGGLRTVSIPTKMKGSTLLSMGYGFAEFKSHSLAEAALKKLNGSVCEEHKLEVKPSDKRLSVASIKKSIDKNDENKSSKLIIRNVAFQATVAELKSLFSTFGSVKRVRIPKKMGGDHRGFAFIDFATHAEAVSAMTSLKQAHLYGRHLIIEWAKDEDEDLNILRKRASINDKAIKSDHKKKKLDDSVGDGFGGGSDGFGGISGFRDGDDE